MNTEIYIYIYILFSYMFVFMEYIIKKRRKGAHE